MSCQQEIVGGGLLARRVVTGINVIIKSNQIKFIC